MVLNSFLAVFMVLFLWSDPSLTPFDLLNNKFKDNFCRLDFNFLVFIIKTKLFSSIFMQKKYIISLQL